LVRINGVAMAAILGSILRPIGVLVVSTCIPAKRTMGMKNRAAVRPCRNGISPLGLPASQVSCVRLVSRAISAPELPSPTTRTGPGFSWSAFL
jgi:hypothetical protein